MKRRIVIVTAILVLILALFVGCNKTPAVDNVKDLNEAFGSISNVVSGSYSIIASSEGKEIYTEQVSYRVSGDGVTYESNINKPNPDMWSENDYVEEKTDGTMTKEELLGLFYDGLELSKSSIDGDIAVIDAEGVKEYSFKLSDPSVVLDVKPSTIQGGVSVAVSVEEKNVRAITIEYSFNGYEIVKKIQIEY